MKVANSRPAFEEGKTQLRGRSVLVKPVMEEMAWLLVGRPLDEMMKFWLC